MTYKDLKSKNILIEVNDRVWGLYRYSVEVILDSGDLLGSSDLKKIAFLRITDLPWQVLMIIKISMT